MRNNLHVIMLLWQEHSEPVSSGIDRPVFHAKRLVGGLGSCHSPLIDGARL